MNDETVKVWDPLVRVFHWTLVLAFTVSYASGEEWLDLHVLAGYLIAGLLGFRVLWGLIGTRHARFSDFVYRPSSIKAYLRDLARLRPRHYLGHNPAGGLMVMILLLSLLATVLTGMAHLAIEEAQGPLVGLVATTGIWPDLFEETHEFFANFTLLLVFVHITGVLVSSLLHGENLVRAMLTGRKSQQVGS